MLTKRQLEDAARCSLIDCEDCSVYCINTIEVTRQAARTALAYRKMLERLEWNNRIPLMNYLPVYEHRCPLCGRHEFNGHASNCELAALLKENKTQETRATIRLIKTKSDHTNNVWECENCGELLYLSSCSPHSNFHYCPNCGIRFDEYVTDTKEGTP